MKVESALSQLTNKANDNAELTGRGELDERSFSILEEMAARMENNYPYESPLYAGQMLKPPHEIARAAYAYAQRINPNNHALDGGRESSKMEIEAVKEIAAMFGWNTSLGHLTGGGTMANMEALWIAHLENPGKKIVASEAAHYTHSRITAVLQIPFVAVPNREDKPVMDVDALEALLKGGEVGTVVVTAGTTGTGHIEPISEVIALANQYNVRVHIDAAYGGYFRLVDLRNDRLNADFQSITKADSVVIDPHKHGLQPYGCGCVLFKDPSVGKHYLHDSPYTYFTSDELHLGEISLECSRPGAAAVALWSTQKRFPLVKDGEMSVGLSRCLLAAQKLYSVLQNSGNWLLPFQPELDIIIFAPKANSTTEISKKSQVIFDNCAEKGLHLALYNMDSKYLAGSVQIDSDRVTCLRSTLMKWNHLDYVEEIGGTLAMSCEG